MLSLLSLISNKWTYAAAIVAALMVTSWGCGCNYGRHHPGLFAPRCHGHDDERSPLRPFRREESPPAEEPSPSPDPISYEAAPVEGTVGAAAAAASNPPALRFLSDL